MTRPYPDALTERVAREVAEVHDVIQAWIRGELPDEDDLWEARFARRFSADFAMITPGGTHVPPTHAVPGVRAMHGSNADFVITTSDAEVLRAGGGLVVARYIEWQRHARHAPATENGRWTTVLFEVEGQALRWVWLHETWLAEELMGALDEHL